MAKIQIMSNTYKQRLKDILQKFSVDPKALGIKLEEEIKLEAEAKLMDGSSIYSSASEWAVGVDCYTKDADGNPVPAPAGEYELEDGSKLVIGDDGLVAEIMTPDMEEEMSSEDMFKAIESLTERVAALETEKQAITSELATEKEKHQKSSNEINSLKTELASLKKAPASSSVKDRNAVALSSIKGEKSTKSFEQMSLKERILSNLETKK